MLYIYNYYSNNTSSFYCHFNSNMSECSTWETPASRPRRHITESTKQTKRRLSLDRLKRKRARPTGEDQAEQVNTNPDDTVGVCEDDTNNIPTGPLAKQRRQNVCVS